MNGRVYDATLARFMSADPHIQEGALTQSYNRYRYVLNNPLKYTDPSGYFFKKLFRSIKKFVKRPINLVKKIYKAPYQLAKKALREIAKVPILNAIVGAAACTFGGPLVCAAFSAMSTYAVTGSLSAGLKAGLIAYSTAAISGYIGGSTDFGTVGTIKAERVIAHDVVGGITSELRGGKFGQGFLSSAFTKSVSGFIQRGAEFITRGASVVSDMVGAMGEAVVGGTASVLGGGKFSNGAQTAAIQYLFNQLRSSLIAERTSTSTSVNGQRHEYKIRGLICTQQTSGCNDQLADRVFNYVNKNDVPFSFSSSEGSGPRTLWGNNPIDHEEYIDQRLTVNIAREGHTFYPGDVTHKVHFENGNLYYDITGVGRGENPGWNNFVGRVTFQPNVSNVLLKYAR